MPEKNEKKNKKKQLESGVSPMGGKAEELWWKGFVENTRFQREIK